MKQTMGKPCPDCPFRNDRPGYLRVARVTKIVESLARGGSFPCHKTTDHDDDEGEHGHISSPDEVQCAGAEIFLAHQGTSTQLSRIAGRLGLPVAELDMTAPVFRNASEMQAAQPDYVEEEGETCAIVGPGCEAPAGHMIGGVVVDGADFVDTWCSCCGEPVCGECMSEDGETCIDCADEEEAAA